MNSVSLPPLEDRFLPPEGWRWHSFRNPKGRTLRFGTVAPKSRVPDAVVIGLQGLGEFTEKYFEVAHTLLGHNLSFWMMDWQGQGKSHRHLKDPQKRHSDGFESDIADLHYFIMEYVKHSAVHPDVGRIPLVMLGHSMGANIGLRYLHEHPDIFACAAFTAPLVGIKAIRHLHAALTLTLTGLMREAFDQSYLEFGGKQWHPDMRLDERHDIHSSDPVRKAIHAAWFAHDPALQVGNVTYGWLHHACRSCAAVQKKDFAPGIKTPCLFALPEDERLVDNHAARTLAARLAGAEVIDLAGAKHEPLMERDGIRNAFFTAFLSLLEAHNIKEKLKPF